MDVTNFPFDEQKCTLTFLSMSYNDQQLKFVPLRKKVDVNSLTSHGEWNIVDASVDTENSPQVTNVSAIVITYRLQRRHVFLLLNTVLPIVFLSLLNIMVFLIPEESGEKISFGITVLLALALSMSMASSMLPRDSTSVSLLIIYIFVLLIISLLTVVLSIVVVLFYHLDERYANSIQEEERSFFMGFFCQALAKKVKSPVTSNQEKLEQPEQIQGKRMSKILDTDSLNDAEREVGTKYRSIGRIINNVSFVVFLCVWFLLTSFIFLKLTVRI
ncbi:neuronal acetylcholine receptor subunit non-alpha-2 [Aplysia californica]|uniref:Neuronal acetylcholine receptor subunit non-alpha-2 n=1 Tax=Aplysia californica TaxID=6500 RepID=A0ABM0JD79_APLCA|nr:neuronal acetylcholine receptor subunit non-alpha-2 [Aplysia californica]